MGHYRIGAPLCSVTKNLPAKQETWYIPGLGRSPGEGREWLPTPVFLPGTSHGQRSLAGCSLWDRERFRGDLATEQQQHYRTQHGQHRCFSGFWLLAWVLAYSQTAGFQGYLLFYLLSNTVRWAVFPPLCGSFLSIFGKLLHTELAGEKTQKHGFAFQG